MALGLAIVFGLMGVINMAHGELMALGAYATFVVQNWFRAHWPGALRLLLPGRAARSRSWWRRASGFVLERGRDPLPLRPAAGDAAADLGRRASSSSRACGSGSAPPTWTSARPRWLSGGDPGDGRRCSCPYNRLFIIGLAAVASAAMYLLLFRTDAGLRIRAVTQNRGDGRLPGRPRAAGWTRSRSRSAPAWPGWPAARSPRSATWARSSARTTSSTRSWSWSPAASASWPGTHPGRGRHRRAQQGHRAGAGRGVRARSPSWSRVILFLQRRPSGLFATKGRYADA